MVDEEVVARASRRAEALGASLNEMVQAYIEQLAGATDPARDAVEFERLSKAARGNSRQWRFNREELQQRR